MTAKTLLAPLSALALALLAGCAAPSAPPSAPAPAPVSGKSADAGTTPVTLALTTFDLETETLVATLRAIPGATLVEAPGLVPGLPCWRGTVRGRPVVVLETGMSVVNAAMSTQRALDRLPVARVLLAGIAGAVNPALHPGDVTVPARWAYHDESAYFNPRPDGRGYLLAPYFRNSGRPNHGMIFPDDVLVWREGQTRTRAMPFFDADPALLAQARAAARRLAATNPAKFAVGGTGVTGSVFVDNADYRRWLTQVWNPECTEMESAAIGHVCWVNRVPFLIIRGLSDLAGGQHGLNEEEIHGNLAARNASALLAELL